MVYGNMKRGSAVWTWLRGFSFHEVAMGETSVTEQDAGAEDVKETGGKGREGEEGNRL